MTQVSARKNTGFVPKRKDRDDVPAASAKMPLLQMKLRKQ